MPRNRVFISYSHKDQEFLAAFKPHLKVWEDQDLLKLWTDQRITPSEDWHDEIQQALSTTAVAVLLISPDFMASDYIRNHELPVLLTAREEGEIELACLYLRTSVVTDDDAAYDVDLSTGETIHHIKLTKYQGFNSPGAVVASLDQHKADAVYAQAAIDIKKLIQRKAHRSARSTTGKRFDLTVRLKRNRTHLTRTYLHQYGALTEDRTPWAPPDIPVTGEALFNTLFSSDAISKKVLQRLFESDSDRPIRYPVRIRLQTDDPVLADLPWPNTEWQGNLLITRGWTFELISPDLDASSLANFPDITLKAPCPVLMIAPQHAPGAALHYRALTERLKHAWPFYHESPILVSTWSDLEMVWRQRQPRMVYYYGPAECDGTALTLLLDDDTGGLDRRPMRDLTALWQHRPPDMWICNLVADPPIALGTAMSDVRVPLVVTQTSNDPIIARRSILDWLHEILEGRDTTDPIWALHQHGQSSTAAWSAYNKWETRTTNQPAKDELARLLVDRKTQRGLGHDVISELVRRGERRLCSVIAYGSKGNRVDLFPDQLYEHFRRNAKEVARVRHIPLNLPTATTFDVKRIEVEIRKQLSLGPRDSFGEALASRIPVGPGRVRPVLLLDWGVRGTSEDNRLSIEALEAWLDFCRHPLSSQCPKELRLVSCLALEVEKDNHPTLEQAVSDLRADARFRDRALRIELLPPLDHINTNDLADFLNGVDNTSCPDDLLADLPELIITKTGGQFEHTIELLEQGERGSWYDLHDELVAESNIIAPGPLSKQTLL